MDNQANLLVLELSRLEELFKAYLTQPSPGETLTQEILSSLNNAMSIAKTSVPPAQQPPYPSDGTASEATTMTKKRKIIPKSTNHEKVVTKVEKVEGIKRPLGDGYSWRKYGQKDIQNAKYPRSYYRCAQSETHDCQAKKLVQQFGENPTTFEVTYINTHVCYPSAQQQCLEDHALQQCLHSGFIHKVSGSDLAAPSLSFPTTPESFLHSSFIPEVSSSDLAVLSLSFPTTPESCLHRSFRREVSCSDLAATFLSYPATPENSKHSGSVYEFSGLDLAAPSLSFPTTPESCLYSDYINEVSGSDLAAPSLSFPTTPESCLHSGFINEVSISELANPSLWFPSNQENYPDFLATENYFMGSFPASSFFSETSGSNYYSVSERYMRLC